MLGLIVNNDSSPLSGGNYKYYQKKRQIPIEPPAGETEDASDVNSASLASESPSSQSVANRL
jgi:hypothetical protein